MPQLLSDHFVKFYSSIKPPMTELGEFVYYRTYSRYDEVRGRRETWAETVRRAVEYNVGLALKAKPDLSRNELRREAEELFHRVFNLEQFLSGRTLWVGGTPVAGLYPLSNFNCSALVLDGFEDFCDLFYLLMVGAGVGFRVLKSDVEKIPEYRTGLSLEVKEYRPLPKELRQQHTSIAVSGHEAVISVGDSKEGWVDALRLFFAVRTEQEYRPVRRVVLTVDSVRPKGERLNTFGGTASGPEALVELFRRGYEIMEKAGGKLRPIDCLDIANLIGGTVVVGGVRRTSEMCVFGADDDEILHAKDSIYTQDESGNWKENKDLLHRRMSNNSLFFETKPSRERLHEVFVSIRRSGEPGFINAEAARKRRADFALTNPCGEVLLADHQTCNLTTNNVLAFVYDKDGETCLDREELFRSVRLSARASLRMTLLDLELPAWDAQQKKDRLTGVSLTGWQDMVGAVGLTKKEEAQLLSELKAVVREAVNSYADELGINRPLLATTVKPEGTLSQLPTVSSGLHYSHSPFFIRRVRISAADPLCKAAEALGWMVVPEVGQSWEDATTKVIEFPVASTSKKTKYEVSAIEQLENYRRFMKHYVEHNASITVSVKDEEWEAVEEWVWEHWDEIVGITFLSLDNHTYQLPPYEAISKSEYLARKNHMRSFDPKVLRKVENGENFDVGNEGCESGVCPIR